MTPAGGDPAEHDHEFDVVQWFPVAEAMRVMSYPNEVGIVQKAVDVVTGKATLGRKRGRGR